MFESVADKPGSLGTFEQSSDPLTVMEAIRHWIDMVMISLGLSAGDAQVRVAESGIALELRREDLRSLQQQHEPSFRRGDIELLTKVSWISNISSPLGTPLLPESPDWAIQYPALPFSRTEMAEKFELRLRQLALGLVSVVDLMCEQEPGLSREDATARVGDNIRINRQFGVGAT